MSRFLPVLLTLPLLLTTLSSSATERHWQTQEYTLNQRPLSELSGLAASGAHPGYYWAHNDSGDRPTLYLIKPGEDKLKSVSVRGASAADWEDMASFSEGDAHYLLVGDIGDNLAIRPMTDIYLLREGGAPQAPSLTLLRRYTLVFDGGPRDVEGLAVDPEQRMVYLLSKRERHPKLYRFSLDSLPDEPVLLSALGEIKSLPTTDSHTPQRKGGITQHSPTGLDFAADGSAAVISTLGESYYFVRQGQQSWLSVLNTSPQALGAPPLRQAESIAISRDGNTILLGSEGLPTKLLSFQPTSH
ncbi:hypothetical protein [Spongiibacter marinus]|uniref:hypothetical protein n=1 Tax=Spongiibacter marinus TaxID=354246 RepID=UPI003C460332